MPCGSRSRRNRRHRQHKKLQRPVTPSAKRDRVKNQPTETLVEEQEKEEEEEEEKEKQEEKKLSPIETPIEYTNGPIVEVQEPEKLEEAIVTTESLRPEELPCVENLSSAKRRSRRNNRCKIEKRVLNTDTQICEITTIRHAVPLEAKIGHIPGVGIVEAPLDSHQTLNEDSTVTVSEPPEPVEPLSEELATKLEKTCTTLAIPAKRFDFLEIHEMSESDAETMETGRSQQQQGVIVEAESDAEHRGASEEEETLLTTTTTQPMSQELESQLRNFIEGLRLPSSATDDRRRRETAAKIEDVVVVAESRGCEEALEAEAEEGGRDVLASDRGVDKPTPKRIVATSGAPLGAYQSQMSQEANKSGINNRCLDVIEEEDTLSTVAKNTDGDDEETEEGGSPPRQSHIRDFINEEISKYRRDSRDPRDAFRYRKWEAKGAVQSGKEKEEKEVEKKVVLVPVESEKSCDIAMEEKRGEDNNAYAECRNVETFMNLVKSLKESVINDFEQMERNEKSSSERSVHVLQQREIKDVEIESRVFQSSSMTISTIATTSNNNNNDDSLNVIQDEKKSYKEEEKEKVRSLNETIELSTEEKVNYEKEEKINELEASVDSDKAANFSREVAAEVKNNNAGGESNNKVDSELATATATAAKRSDAITNDEADDINSGKVINERSNDDDVDDDKLSNVNNDKVELEINDKTDDKDKDSVKDALSDASTEDNVDSITDEEFYPLTITEIESSENCADNSIDTPIAVDRDSTTIPRTLNVERAEEEGAIPPKIDVNSSTIAEQYYAEAPIEPPLIESQEVPSVEQPPPIPPSPPRRSTSLYQQQHEQQMLASEAAYFPLFPIPVIERIIVIDRIPPAVHSPSRYRRFQHAYGYGPPRVPLRPSYSDLHERAVLEAYANELEERAEIVEFVKSLLVLLSSCESSRRDVRELLARYDLEKLPPDVRNVVEDLMGPEDGHASLKREDVIAEEGEETENNENPSSNFNLRQQQQYASPSSSSAATTCTTVKLNDRYSSSAAAGSGPSAEQHKQYKQLSNVDEVRNREDHLYYVPLEDSNLGSDSSPRTAANFGREDLPDSLKDLCFKKILSMRPSADNNCDNLTPTEHEKFDENECKRSDEVKLRSSEATWKGVPTKENPKLLVCFSPAQQESQIKTSPENLLDLHKKFINRSGYHHEHDYSSQHSEVSPPKYLVDVSPLETPKKDEGHRRNPHLLDEGMSSTKRLLSIIRENPLPAAAKRSNNNKCLSDSARIEKQQQQREEHQERLRANRLSDWLSLDNDATTTTTTGSASGDGLLIDGGRQRLRSDDKPTKTESEPWNATPTALLRRSPIHFENNNNNYNDNHSQRQLYSPLSFAKAAVGVEPWYVNPALIIEDKSEVPTKVKRYVTVDRDCIDTRNLFDQGPLLEQSCNSGRQEEQPLRSSSSCSGRRLGAIEALKNPVMRQPRDNTAADSSSSSFVIDSNETDNRKRFSLPQEYFDRQLRYIEHLQSKLNATAFKRDTTTFRMESGEDREQQQQQQQQQQTKDDNDEGHTQRDEWRESAKRVEGDSTEYESKEGSRESKREIKRSENGCYSSETSCETLEERKERTTTTISTHDDGIEESKLKKFLRDLNDPSLDEPISVRPSLPPRSKPKKDNVAQATLDESFRQQMYDEYVHKVLEREERKQHKVIKISSHADLPVNGKRPRNKRADFSSMNKVEREFIEKAKSRLDKHGIKLDESETEGASSGSELAAHPPIGKSESKSEAKDEAKVLVDGKEVKDARRLPKHLREFLEISVAKQEEDKEERQPSDDDDNVKEEEEEEEAVANLPNKEAAKRRRADNASDLLHEIDGALRLGKGFLLGREMIAPTFKASKSAKPGVWSPGSASDKSTKQISPEGSSKDGRDEPIPPIWTPSSAGPSPVPERKEFRPVPFESPILGRKKAPQHQQQQQQAPPPAKSDTASSPPWEEEGGHRTSSQGHSGTSRIVNSYSAPAQGLNALAGAPRLPRAQNPTITLLQKAREGQLPKGAAYLDETDHIASGRDEKPLLSPGEVTYHSLRKGYESEPEHYNERTKKKVVLKPRKYEGIGPTTRNGMPIVLRSEVKEGNQAKWYKQMYDSLHRAPKHDDYVTVRYKPNRGGTRTGYSGTSSGYLSEPEPRSYTERSATLDNRTRHRQRHKDNDFSTLPRPTGRLDGHYSPDTYHMNPGRIEDYVPGNCSIQEKETKEPPSDLSWAKRKWWDEVMDIFDGWLDENGHSQRREPAQVAAVSLVGSTPTSTLLQRTDRNRSTAGLLGYQQPSRRFSHSLTTSTSSRSLRGSAAAAAAALEQRLFQAGSGARRSRSHVTVASASSKIRRDLELQDEQQRMRQSRLLESLFELASARTGSGGGRPRSGSTGDSERRLIKPLAHDDEDDDDDDDDEDDDEDDMVGGKSSWAYLGPASAGARVAILATTAKSSCTDIGTAAATITANHLHQPHQINNNSNHHRHNNQRHGLRPSAASRQQQQQNGASSTTAANSAATANTQQQQQQAALSSSASSSSSVTNSSSNGTTTTSTNHAAPFEQSNTHSPKSYMTHALKESGYESDSTLVFRRREDVSPLSPLEQRIAYKTVQKGGDVPLHGLRKPAPERPKDDTEIEYIPISSSLTRLRVNRKKLQQQQQKQHRSDSASPASSTSSMNNVPPSRIPVVTSMASSGKREQTHPIQTASCSTLLPTRKIASPITGGTTSKVPSPPKRKSSRNNRTLKLYSASSSSVSNAQQPRHEQCFVDLKKRRSEPCLSPRSASSSTPSPRSQLLKKSRSTEVKKTWISSTTISRDSTRSVQSQQQTPKKDQKVRGRTRKEQEESCKRLSRSAVDLTSPVEVRRVLQRQREKERYPRMVNAKLQPSGTFVKSSSTPHTTTLGTDGSRTLKITGTISPRGKEILGKSTAMSSKSKSLIPEKKRKVRDKSISRKETKPLSKSSKSKESNKESPKVDQSIGLTIEMLKRHHEATMSDSFFQHLFLRNSITQRSRSPSQTSSLLMRHSSVLERARALQDAGCYSSDGYKSEPSLKSLGIYLAHKRPVSNSRFKNWERESLSSRSSSPWIDFRGSSSSLRARSPDLTRECPKERSLSEPPLKTLRESPDSQSRRSQSPSPLRSPAIRKIHGLRHDFSDRGSDLSLTRSASSLFGFPIEREEYQRYILERLRSRQKSKKYRDLRDFYTSLERMASLEKTASSGDLRPRLKNEEIIDYERWKQLRAKEKAEQELKGLYRKLKLDQKEKDFLFSTRSVESIKWRGDSSLRCKERSVESIKEQFHKLEREESELEAVRRRELTSRKDVYKPLWRGNSVASVASSMAKRAAERTDYDRTSVRASLQKSLGGSSKFWSSLSIEQVTALKNQLNDIYGNDPPPSATSRKKPMEESTLSSDLSVSKYEILVGPGEVKKCEDLHVRCHSMMIAPERPVDTVKRSGSSICRVSSLERSQSDRAQSSESTMTEGEKKRLSLTLGKEMLEKVGQRLASSCMQVTPRETRGALAAALAVKKSPPTADQIDFVDSGSATESSDASVKTVVQRSVSSAQWSERPLRSDYSEDLQKKLDFFESKPKLSSSRSYTDLKDLFGESATARQSSMGLGAITRSRSASPAKPEQIAADGGSSPSGSPDVVASTRTRRRQQQQRPARPCDRDEEEEEEEEIEKTRCCSSVSSSPTIATAAASTATRDFSPSPSLESIWLRCGSPDPEKYWRSYLKLLRDGSVRRLRAKFESLEELSRPSGLRKLAASKRFQSDPELARNLLKKVTDNSKNYIKPHEIPDVAWLRRKYEPPPSYRARRRRAGGSPIPRLPWRLEDLAMPHINVISKTAELKSAASTQQQLQQSVASEREEIARELRARRPVSRTREMFERGSSPDSKSGTTSILGEMFTSAPDVRELRDIAPYLAGRWVAHRFPSRYDNSRSLSSPPDLSRGSITPPSRRGRGTATSCCSSRSSSASPTRPRTILKPQQQQQQKESTPQQQKPQSSDVFANQPFDPSKHRPRFRYQPPPPPLPLLPPPKIRYGATRSWCPPIPSYAARPSHVTFEGPDAHRSVNV